LLRRTRRGCPSLRHPDVPHHVYEHNGGQVDQDYLNESGDASVKLGQALPESPESIFRLMPLILKRAQNLHEGFHVLFPPVAKPIK